MPRPNRGPYIKLGPSGYYYIIRYEGGRPDRISTRTKNPKLAEAALREYLIEQERRAIPVGMTVAEAWQVYYDEHVRLNVVARDRLDYAWRQLEPHFGTRQLRELETRDFHEYRTRRELMGVEPSTVRRELSALATALNHLVKTKRLASSDVPYIPLPPSAPPRDRWLTEAEIEQLLAVAAERRRGPRLSRIERFLHIALRSAQRKGVIERLKWEQVDFARGLIDFNGRTADGRQRVQTKKRKPVVPIADKLLPVLRRAYDERVSDFVLDQPGSIRKSFETLVAAAGMPEVTPHVLRHTWATHAAMKGVHLVDIARVLGNSLAMVEKVYAKWAPEYLRGAINFGAEEKAA